MEQLTLGPTPGDEDSAQLGTCDYRIRVRHEGRAYIGQSFACSAALPPAPTSVSNPSRTTSERITRWSCASIPPSRPRSSLHTTSRGTCPAEWDEQARTELANTRHPA
jgi:hypothetical protein